MGRRKFLGALMVYTQTKLHWGGTTTSLAIIWGTHFLWGNKTYLATALMPLEYKGNNNGGGLSPKGKKRALGETGGSCGITGQAEFTLMSRDSSWKKTCYLEWADQEDPMTSPKSVIWNTHLDRQKYRRIGLRPPQNVTPVANAARGRWWFSYLLLSVPESSAQVITR